MRGKNFSFTDEDLDVLLLVRLIFGLDYKGRV